MKNHTYHHRARAFTLVELLVVIVIVAVLATVAIVFARKGLTKATEARALSRLRESGAVLLADAQEKNGKMQYAIDVTAQDSPYLPYNIVRKAVGMTIPTAPLQADADICEIMHWDAKKVKPKVFVQNCFGVNMTIIPDEPEGFGVVWKDEDVDLDGSPVKVRTLVTTTVKRPEFYPFLLDSSNDKGAEIYRIRDTESGYVGLRNSGKAHGYFLDGSARELGLKELKEAGFSKAVDPTTNPPTMHSF